MKNLIQCQERLVKEDQEAMRRLLLCNGTDYISKQTIVNLLWSFEVEV